MTHRSSCNGGASLSVDVISSPCTCQETYLTAVHPSREIMSRTTGNHHQHLLESSRFMSSSTKRTLQNVHAENDAIILSCFWKMEARLLLRGAANYTDFRKRRQAFYLYDYHVLQSLYHSYCSILINIMSSPLMQTNKVTEQNPDFHPLGKFTVNN